MRANFFLAPPSPYHSSLRQKNTKPAFHKSFEVKHLSIADLVLISSGYSFKCDVMSNSKVSEVTSRGLLSHEGQFVSPMLGFTISSLTYVEEHSCLRKGPW